MSLEFDGSSKNELSHIYAEEPRILRELADGTDDLEALERLREIATERALADEFNIDADNVALFIHQKIEDIKDKRLQASHTQVAKWLEQDKERERRFLDVFMHIHDTDSPQLATEEEARIALFKEK